MGNKLATIENSVVMPAVNAAQALEIWTQYQDLITQVCTDEDYQIIEDKKFRKKSGWRKIATFFNLSVEVVNESHEQIGKTMVWHFTCRAVAPNGRFVEGVGSCDAYEKATLRDGKYLKKGNVTKWGKSSSGKNYPLEWEWVEAAPNSLHNIRSTAETRAYNRAVSNLVGGGEVSAEEIVDEEHGNGYVANEPKEMKKAIQEDAPQQNEKASEKQIELIKKYASSEDGKIKDLLEGIVLDQLTKKEATGLIGELLKIKPRK